MVLHRGRATSPGRKGGATGVAAAGRKGRNSQASNQHDLFVHGRHQTSGQTKLTSAALSTLPRQESYNLSGWDTDSPSPTPFLRPTSAAELPPGDTVNITSSSRTRLSAAPGAAYTGVVTAPSPPPAGNDLGTMVLKIPENNAGSPVPSPGRKLAQSPRKVITKAEAPPAGGGITRTLSTNKHRPVPMGFLSGRGNVRLFSPIKGQPSLPEAQIKAAEATKATEANKEATIAAKVVLRSPRASVTSPSRSRAGSTKATPRGGPSQEGSNVNATNSQYNVTSMASKTSQLLEELEERMSELSEDFLEFLDRMDRAADPDHNDPISLPPDVAASILEIGLKEITPVDFLLQQFDNHRAFHNAEKRRRQEQAAKRELAATGSLDPTTGKWVAAQEATSPKRQRNGHADTGMTDAERASEILELTTRFVDNLRSEDKNGPMFHKFQEFRQTLRLQISPTRPPRDDEDDRSPRRDISPGKGQHIKFPEFSFSGSAPVQNIEKGNFAAKTEKDLSTVEAKFLRDKSSYYPLEPTFRPAPSVMLAADGRGKTGVTKYDKIADHPWGEEVRGISPSPLEPGSPMAQVVTYRGPAGAYMHRRIRQEPSNLREPDLEEQLMRYDAFVTTQATRRAESPSETSSMSKSPTRRHPALLDLTAGASGRRSPQSRRRGGTAPDLALTKQLNVQLGAVTSLFGGLDPFSDDWDPPHPIASA